MGFHSRLTGHLVLWFMSGWCGYSVMDPVISPDVSRALTLCLLWKTSGPPATEPRPYNHQWSITSAAINALNSVFPPRVWPPGRPVGKSDGLTELLHIPNSAKVFNIKDPHPGMWSIKVRKHLGVCANYFYYWCVDITCFPADSQEVVPCCNLKRRSELTSQEVEVTQKQRSHVWVPVLLVPDVGNDQHFYLSDLSKGLKRPRFPLYICCRGSWLPLWLAYWTYLCLPSDVMFLRRNVENSWGILALRCVGFLQG